MYKKLLKQREWRLRWAEKVGTGFTLPDHQQAAEASNGKSGKILQFRKSWLSRLESGGREGFEPSASPLRTVGKIS
jgi:hypothetical protein